MEPLERPTPRWRIAESGRACGDDQVRVEHDVRATRDAPALDGRHGRFDGVVQLGPRCRERADEVLVGGAVPRPSGVCCTGLGGRRAGQLVAGAEGRTLGIQQDDAHVPVVLGDVELVPELVAQRRRDRVVLLGPAQREAAHRAVVGCPNRSPHGAECRDAVRRPSSVSKLARRGTKSLS